MRQVIINYKWEIIILTSYLFVALPICITSALNSIH